MERPFEHDIEALITDFIRSQGGKTVIEKLGFQPDYNNADYIFEEENIIIELKCLEKDIFSETDDKVRNEILLNKWINENQISFSDLLLIILGRKELPQTCLDDILKLTRKTFQRILEKANKQLSVTKNEIGNQETKRFLMLCNDGNFFLNHEQILGLTYNILSSRQEINVDCIIYFTINQGSLIENSDLDWHLWVPAYNCDPEENKMSGFVNELRRRLNLFIIDRFGITINEHIEIRDKEAGTEIIKKMNYIPKEISYKKSSS